MVSRMNLHRTDYLRQAEELAQFVQSTELGGRVKNFGKDVVNVVEPLLNPRKIEHVKKPTIDPDSRRCYRCGALGHIKARFLKGKKKKMRILF